MSQAEQIMETAQIRKNDLNLPYAGAVTSEEAYQLLENLAQALLVDVRTKAERDWVGMIKLSADKNANIHHHIEWNTYPGGTRNEQFLDQLSAVLADELKSNTPIFFLCRSGVRSDGAARLATEHGYVCYNILEGFEGDKDAAGHRKTVGGWCDKGLPWVGA